MGRGGKVSTSFDLQTYFRASKKVVVEIRFEKMRYKCSL